MGNLLEPFPITSKFKMNMFVKWHLVGTVMIKNNKGLPPIKQTTFDGLIGNNSAAFSMMAGWLFCWRYPDITLLTRGFSK